ncbi:MAG: sulfite exporter TauE/SafE family protein [Dehalococcoidia bacterium]
MVKVQSIAWMGKINFVNVYTLLLWLYVLRNAVVLGYDRSMIIETEVLLMGTIVFFFAGLTQGLTGFGFGLVAVPILGFIISPKMIAPMVVIYTSFTNLLVLNNAKAHLNIRRIYVLTTAGVLTIPLGTWMISYMTPDHLRLFIGFAVTISAILMSAGIRLKIVRERLASAVVGVVSGILSGSIAIGGPPVILFFSNQEVPREEFRANIAAYFFPISLAANVSFYFAGLLTLETVLYALWFVPALVLGVAIGNKYNNLLSEIIYRRVALIVVFFAGILSILNGAGVL